jgi:hypothetical protein
MHAYRDKKVVGVFVRFFVRRFETDYKAPTDHEYHGCAKRMNFLLKGLVAEWQCALPVNVMC